MGPRRISKWGLAAEYSLIMAWVGCARSLPAPPTLHMDGRHHLRPPPPLNTTPPPPHAGRRHLLALQLSALMLQGGGIDATTALPRRDPLNRFRLYQGGFNIEDKHYWSSVMFTGVWAFAMALFCLYAGFISLAWYCCIHFSSMDKLSMNLHPYLRTEALRSIHFCVLQFSVFAIVSSGVIIWGISQIGGELNGSADIIMTSIDEVVNQVQSAVVAIENATAPLMMRSLVYAIQRASNKLNMTARSLQSDARALQTKAYRIFTLVKFGLVSTAITIPTLVLGGLLGILKVWDRSIAWMFVLMACLLIASWILTGLCFILSKTMQNTNVLMMLSAIV